MHIKCHLPDNLFGAHLGYDGTEEWRCCSVPVIGSNVVLDRIDICTCRNVRRHAALWEGDRQNTNETLYSAYVRTMNSGQ